MKKKWKVIIDITITILIVSWIVCLLSYGPETIVDNIGISNGYLLTIVASFLGGLVMISFIATYPTIAIFALGGLNPIILGIFAAIGLTLANILYFYLGLKGRTVATTSYSKFTKISHSILKWINKKPNWVIPILIWAYVGLSPFPNNLLTVSGGLIDYPFKKMLIAVLLGNITLMTLFGYLTIISTEFLI